MKMIDNFDTFPFDWSDPDCFYFIQLINRKSQAGNNKVRCIKSYYIDTPEYLEKKMEEMKAIADLMQCRIYMHPARRNKAKVGLALLQYVAECFVKNTLDRVWR